MKISYQALINQSEFSSLRPWLDELETKLKSEFSIEKHGRLNEWQEILASLPDITTQTYRFDQATVQIGKVSEINDADKSVLQASLRQLHPWRKGPFDVFGVHIDTEWRSNWKWERLQDAIQPLKGRLVLDVGCGSGYHCWRMLGAGASRVIGIEPIMLYVMQFQALKRFTGQPPIDVLPMTLEQLPDSLQAFDTVFSMGVMYHRRSPIDHLTKLHGCLRPGGELVLETLIIEGKDGKTLIPEGRYAKMRNVWFIPDVPTLKVWLKRSSFSNIKLIDINRTTKEEQRTTSWMRFESLQDFLDPQDHRLTIEGYPAPVRAILTATAN